MRFVVETKPDISTRTRVLNYGCQLLQKIGFSPNSKAEQEVLERYIRLLHRSFPDRLSPEEVEKANTDGDWDVYEKDRIGRKSVFDSRPVEKTMQGLAVPLVQEAIQIDSSIQSVLEIGAYYGWTLNYLASANPNIQFHGIDFPWVMNKLNEEFTQPNLSFSIGYALDAMEKERVYGDLVMSSSTALRFRNAEFKRYLDIMIKTGARWFVANEVMIPRQDGTFIDPCLVDPEFSIPVIYKNSAPGMDPCYIHNYRDILTSKGFSILHYRIYAPLAPHEYRIEIVARRH